MTRDALIELSRKISHDIKVFKSRTGKYPNHIIMGGQPDRTMTLSSICGITVKMDYFKDSSEYRLLYENGDNYIEMEIADHE